MKSIIISAMLNNSAKTTFVLGLLEYLKKENKAALGFKIGPDFIDPLFHEAITGIKSHNLDSFFLEKNLLLDYYQKISTGYEFVIIEGIMGLLDGLPGGKASTDEVASILDIPVLLLVESNPSARSMAAMIDGIIRNSMSRIRGIVVTKSESEELFQIQKKEISSLTGIDFIKRFPFEESIYIPSPSTGMYNDFSIIRNVASRSALLINQYIDIESFFDLFCSKDSADKTTTKKEIHDTQGIMSKSEKKEPTQKKRKIAAVSHDHAFLFHYSANLEWLEKKGYTIVFFSPLHDKKAPDASLYYLTGGYPETFSNQLSNNKYMLNFFREVCEEGKKYIIAEGGGFMYLTTSIDKYPMVGFIKGRTKTTNKIQGCCGYQTIQILQNCFFPAGTHLKGHECHFCFTELEEQQNAFAITKASDQESLESGIIKKKVLASYSHLFFPSIEEDIEIG